ncbi:hypothetical protein [uncultured Chryseobacterium sp.]|uniref:hypothetical protein n=1 Tax=uncultured Chryseobacterium sp. TaxID=259322 RepID=UPI0025898024|nr:hypothetical protein [uncultured Chryseobacterium sp.]
MKIFLSWSGDRSRKVAELLDNWLQCVIQAVNPWMSSKDIDRGALWFAEISDQLAGTGIGIICLTKENRLKPWILFESGALAKGISSNRVCTFLIDLEATDVENPLAQFNHTKPNKTGLWELIRTINITLKENSLKENILEKVFDTYWPQFEKDFNNIIKNTLDTEIEEKRSENDILLEVLTSIRTIDKRIRTIENNEQTSISQKRISRFEAEEFLQSLFESGVSLDVIKYLANQKSIPEYFTKKKIEQFSREKTDR